jgi:hypothetical protein
LSRVQLRDYLTQLEKYGQGGVKQLENGRFRFYDNIKPAPTPGEMQGARFVREWDPATNARRGWYETLDHSGNIRSVRPEAGGAKVHYIFDANGNYTSTR